jgi:hypothetical protein
MNGVASAPRPRDGVELACYKVRHLAVLLGMSERSVRRLAADGSIPGQLAFSRTRRWSRRVVDNWLAAGGAIDLT